MVSTRPVLIVAFATLGLCTGCFSMTGLDLFGSGGGVYVAFEIQPSFVLTGAVIAPSVQVSVHDSRQQYGSSGPEYTVRLSITTGTGTAGAVLSGTLTKATINGVATFPDLAIDKPGAAYTLSATIPGSTYPEISAPFNVTGPPTSVLVTPPTVGLTVIGDSLQLTATARDAGGIVTGNREFTWASSDTTRVRVSASGFVKAVAIGTATVRATLGGLSDGTGVSVAPIDGGVVAVSAGGDFSCAVTSAGGAYCWGLNQYGELGIGVVDTWSWPTHTAPVAVTGGLRFASVSAGCGVTTSGAAYCWGPGSFPSTIGTPSAVPGGLTFSIVSAGYDHTCGLTAGGAAYCWGTNLYGELGVGTFTLASNGCAGSTVNPGCSTTPLAVFGGLTFTVVSAGAMHTCALTAGGVAYCWGSNGFGELGNGTRSYASNMPVAVSGGLAFASVSAGSEHTCGLTSAGVAYCWGINDAGQLGNGSRDTLAHAAPVPVAGGLTFQSVSAGGGFTCGVAAGGAAYCWGRDGAAAIDNSTFINSPVPVAVAGGLAFSSVSAGGAHACGLTTDGVAYCWGANDSGQLGNGTTVTSPVPVRVAGQP